MIKPDWISEDGSVQLYCGDCSQVLKCLKDESVEMVWTDPPYGHSNHSGDWNARLNEHRGIESKPIKNDSADGMRSIVDSALKECTRVLVADCCCCCCCVGGGPRPTFAWVANRLDSDGLSFFHSVIWDKKNPGLGWRYRRQHEMVMVAHRSGGTLRWPNKKETQRNIISVSKPRNTEHPNEKPLSLVQRFVSLHTSENETVLDPFMGSGTTGVACVNTGRKFIGIEIDKDYFEIAKNRIQQAIKNKSEQNIPA